jgi:hypothetical protein
MATPGKFKSENTLLNFNLTLTASFYVQITGEKAAKIRAARQSQKNRKESTVGETQILDHGISPEEAIEHLNKIMSPYTIEFDGPMSWFAVWRGKSLHSKMIHVLANFLSQ